MTYYFDISGGSKTASALREMRRLLALACTARRAQLVLGDFVVSSLLTNDRSIVSCERLSTSFFLVAFRERSHHATRKLSDLKLSRSTISDHSSSTDQGSQMAPPRRPGG